MTSNPQLEMPDRTHRSNNRARDSNRAHTASVGPDVWLLDLDVPLRTYLARSSLDHDVAALAKSGTLHWESQRGPSMGALKVDIVGFVVGLNVSAGGVGARCIVEKR